MVISDVTINGICKPGFEPIRDEFGETVVAYVQVEAGAANFEQALKGYLYDRLAN